MSVLKKAFAVTIACSLLVGLAGCDSGGKSQKMKNRERDEDGRNQHMPAAQMFDQEKDAIQA